MGWIWTWGQSQTREGKMHSEWKGVKRNRWPQKVQKWTDHWEDRTLDLFRHLHSCNCKGNVLTTGPNDHSIVRLLEGHILVMESSSPEAGHTCKYLQNQLQNNRLQEHHKPWKWIVSILRWFLTRRESICVGYTPIFWTRSFHSFPAGYMVIEILCPQINLHYFSIISIWARCVHSEKHGR